MLAAQAVRRVTVRQLHPEIPNSELIKVFSLLSIKNQRELMTELSLIISYNPREIKHLLDLAKFSYVISHSGVKTGQIQVIYIWWSTCSWPVYWWWSPWSSQPEWWWSKILLLSMSFQSTTISHFRPTPDHGDDEHNF